MQLTAIKMQAQYKVSQSNQTQKTLDSTHIAQGILHKHGLDIRQPDSTLQT